MTTPNAIAPASHEPKWKLLPKGPPQILACLNDPEMKAQFKAALPRCGLTPDRLMRLALNTLTANPKLLQCTTMSVFNGVMRAYALGLEIGGSLQQCHVIPRLLSVKNDDGSYSKVMTASFQMGYPGWVELIYRSGAVSKLNVGVIHARDTFEVIEGSDEKIVHKPFIGPGTSPEADDPGPMLGAYVVWAMKDGSKKQTWMSKREIDSIRLRSKSGDDGPWVTDFEQMGVKTVIIRAAKTMPKSVQLALAPAIKAHEMAEEGVAGSESVLFGSDQDPESVDLPQTEAPKTEATADAAPVKRRTRTIILEKTDAKTEPKADGALADLIAKHEAVRASDPEAFGIAWKIENVKADWSASVAPFSLLGWPADRMKAVLVEIESFQKQYPPEPKGGK